MNIELGFQYVVNSSHHSNEWAKKRLSEKHQADEARNYLAKLSRLKPGVVSLLYMQPHDRISSVEISYDIVNKVFTLMKEQENEEEEDNGISSEEDDDCEVIGNTEAESTENFINNSNKTTKNHIDNSTTNDTNLGFSNMNFHDSAEPKKIDGKHEENGEDSGGGSGDTLKKSPSNRTKSCNFPKLFLFFCFFYFIALKN